ncbi:hypothetical protein Pelo_18334 [Pelomyxa schiedti]|nr:hypothetical protein Pelo_18334 [Pelomyxa schiedti]
MNRHRGPHPAVTVSLKAKDQFRVSAVLGSVIIIGDDDDDPVHWVCTESSVFHHRGTINANHCNGVESLFYLEDFARAAYMRSNDGRHGWWLVQDGAIGDAFSLNPRWFVDLQAKDHNLVIAPTTSPVEGTKGADANVQLVVVVDVPIIVDDGEHVQFFLDNTCHDEGVVCKLIKNAAGSMTVVELSRVDIGKTWASKRLSVLSSTRCQLGNAVSIRDALVLHKRDGSRAFILSAMCDQRCLYPQTFFQVDEGITTTFGSVLFTLPHHCCTPGGGGGRDLAISTSQLTDSLFCVAYLSANCSCQQQVEIWDINGQATTGSRSPLKAIKLSASVRELVAEGGLLVSLLIRRTTRDIVLTDPETGAQILTLSGQIENNSLSDTMSFLCYKSMW